MKLIAAWLGVQAFRCNRPRPVTAPRRATPRRESGVSYRGRLRASQCGYTSRRNLPPLHHRLGGCLPYLSLMQVTPEPQVQWWELLSPYEAALSQARPPEKPLLGSDFNLAVYWATGRAGWVTERTRRVFMVRGKQLRLH